MAPGSARVLGPRPKNATGAAAVAIGFGADVPMVLALLLMAQLVVGALAYAVIVRRH